MPYSPAVRRACRGSYDPMKRSIYAKFIATYAAIAVLILGLVVTLGSYLIERELLREESGAAVQQAYTIAGSLSTVRLENSTAITEVTRSLGLTASFEKSGLWIIDPEGKILVNVGSFRAPADVSEIENFDPASFGKTGYEISNFFGVFSENALHVISPITNGLSIRGYVAVHKSLTALYAERDRMVTILFIMAVVFVAISLLFLLQFTMSVYRPLLRITEGSEQFSRGNLSHRIEVTQNDEIGYLAGTMNVMASELDKANAYQRKFVANISHDFRSPLTSIRGFTEAMLDGTIPPEMHDKYLTIISQEAQRLTELTQSTMNLANMDVDAAMLKRTDFDINAMIRDTAALFEGSCRDKKLRISLVLCGDTFLVNADEEKIKQVLYNLLDNAIKFSDKNSEIKIETSERRERCYVSVKDHGCGIRKEDLARIWDRFYKIDPSRGKDRRGAGLGLAIVREIIKAHGQNINVISTEGVGTEFEFSLDLAETEE